VVYFDKIYCYLPFSRYRLSSLHSTFWHANPHSHPTSRPRNITKSLRMWRERKISCLALTNSRRLGNTSVMSLTPSISEKARESTTGKYKLAAIITLISALVAFILSLIAFLSNARNGQLQQYELIMVCWPMASSICALTNDLVCCSSILLNCYQMQSKSRLQPQPQ
jgi:hypothetical protein